MYDRILVPLDGSAYSEEVIPWVAGLAAVHGTPVALLRVVEKEAERGEATSYVEKLAAGLSARGLCVVGSGDIADVVLAEARSVPGTLVAMTSHGRSGLVEAMLGSVALRLVRGGGAPVLVYRPTGASGRGTAPVKIKSVVLPLDGSQLSEAMAPQAAEMARWIDAELVVVAAIDPEATASANIPAGDVMESSYVRSKAGEFATRYGVRASWEVLHGEPADAIAGFLEGRRDAMLAMVTRGRRALESALLGSVTSGCLRKAGVPVLTRLP